MATLGEGFYKAMTGRTARLESGPATNQVVFLEKKYGNLSEASRRTGIPRTTLRRWRDGKSTPAGENSRKLTRSVRESLVPEGRRKRVTRSTGNPERARGERRTGKGSTASGHGGLTITATVSISSDSRERTLYVGQHLSEEKGQELMGAFLAGDDAAFEREITEALNKYFGGSGWTVESVTGVGFDPIK